MKIYCGFCEKDLSNLEGKIMVTKKEYLSKDSIANLKIACNSCKKEEYISLFSLEKFFKNGNTIVEKIKKEHEENIYSINVDSLNVLSDLLPCVENVFWGEECDYEHEINPYWEEYEYSSEDEYLISEAGGTKNELYNMDFKKWIHYKKFFEVYINVAKKTTKNDNSEKTTHNLSEIFEKMQKDEMTLVEEIQRWIKKAQIYKDDSNHYKTLIKYLIDNYKSVENYQKTLEEAFFEIQKLISRYLLRFYNVKIDLEYIQEEQQIEKKQRANGNWID